MQYCQPLKATNNDAKSKGLPGQHKELREGEGKLEGIRGPFVQKGGRTAKMQQSGGKRLIRKKEAWEDRIGMGQLMPDETFKVKETQKIRRDYLKELMHNEVGKNGLRFRSKFLSRHKVSSEVRVRMVGNPANARSIG